MSNQPDPIQKSKRVDAIAALLSPYIVRFILSKTGMPVHEDLMILLNSGVTEVISVAIAAVLIAWSNATEKVFPCSQENQK